MRSTVTIKDILSSACGSINQHLAVEKPKKKKGGVKLSKEKTWIQFRLEEYAKEKRLELKTEYRFDGKRRWKFDWCFPKIKTAIEYEGIFSAKSRHTTAIGFTGDTEKYNRAQQLGWKVLRFTALNYLDLMIELNRVP